MLNKQKMRHPQSEQPLKHFGLKPMYIHATK